MDLMSLARRCQRIVFLLSIILLSACTQAHAQSIVREWRRVFDSGGVDQASGIDVTSAGDVYVVGTASSQDTTSLLLLRYDGDGGLRFSKQMGTDVLCPLTEPLVAADADLCAVVAGYDSGEELVQGGGFVARISGAGDLLWTYQLGAVSCPSALVADTRSSLIYVIDDFWMSPATAKLSVLTLDGEEVCTDFAWNPHLTANMSIHDDSIFIVGRGGWEHNTVSMLRFDGACQRTWFSEIGLGGSDDGVAVLPVGGYTAFAGNIETCGNTDIWVGIYNGFMESVEFFSFDLNGRDDRVSGGITDGGDGALAGSSEDGSADVLVGRFGPWGGDSWWTYDGPAGGDDRGVDIDFLPSGEIVVLAQVAGTLDNDQALLLYSRDGQLLDVDLDSFNDNPTGLAITSEGAIYTASWNPEGAPHAPGDIIVNKYSVSAVGIGSAEAPAILRVGAPEPNPSSGSVTIPYELPDDGDVTIGIYDASGRPVRTLATGPGVRDRQEVVWDGLADRGESVASGVYFVRFDFGNRVERRQVVLAR